MLKNKLKIPEGWKVKSFNDCFDIATKINGLKKSDYKKNGKYPIIDQGQSFISGYADDIALVQEKIPSIIFGDHTRIIKYIDFEHILGNDGTKIFWSKEGNNLKFLYYLIQMIDIPNTGYNRHFKYLEQEKLNIPTIFEQQKIAEILGIVDENIEKTDEVIKQTEKLKRGLMKELLTRGIGHTKFKKTKLGEIPEDWQVLKFEDCVVVAPKLNGLKTNQYEDRGRYPIIDQGQSFVSGYTNSNDLLQKESSIVFGDHTRILKFINFDYVLGNDGTKVFWQNKIVNLKFFYYLLTTFKILNTGYNRHYKYLQDGIFAIPDKNEEQMKIVEILTCIDKKILVNKELKDKTLKLKKGLMLDLLSGRIRINN